MELTPEQANSFVGFVKGANLTVQTALEKVAGFEDSAKQAATANEALLPELQAAGLITAKDLPICRELLGSHAGTVQMLKWACEALQEERGRMAKAAALNTGDAAPDFKNTNRYGPRDSALARIADPV